MDTAHVWQRATSVIDIWHCVDLSGRLLATVQIQPGGQRWRWTVLRQDKPPRAHRTDFAPSREEAQQAVENYLSDG